MGGDMSILEQYRHFSELQKQLQDLSQIILLAIILQDNAILLQFLEVITFLSGIHKTFARNLLLGRTFQRRSKKTLLAGILEDLASLCTSNALSFKIPHEFYKISEYRKRLLHFHSHGFFHWPHCQNVQQNKTVYFNPLVTISSFNPAEP